MELELGLKITKVVDDISSANLLISKNRGGALFLSSETDTMFILTAHLNGYRRENVKIDIDKDGTKIKISGEKPVQEMVMVGWKVITKDIEIKGFRKSFKIPDGVILDKIKARFNDEASLLTISIPKIKTGVVSGKGLEELEDELNLTSDSQASDSNEGKRSIQENQESEFNEAKKTENGKGQWKEELEEESKCNHKEDNVEKAFMQGKADKENGNEEVIEEKESEKASAVGENKVNDEIEREKNEDRDAKKDAENGPKCDRKEDEAKETSIQENQESKEERENCEAEVTEKENSKKGSPVQANEQIHEEQKNVIEDATEFVHQKDDYIATTSPADQTVDQDNVQKDNTPQEKSKLCVPVVVGSALVVSFIVFVFHFIKSKNQNSRRRD